MIKHQKHSMNYIDNVYLPGSNPELAAGSFITPFH
jgi:hypothetical protein